MTVTLLYRPSVLAGRAPAVVATLAHATNDAYAAFLPALLPVYYLRLGMDEASLAALVAIFAVSASLPGPFLGLLADRVGAREVTAFSVLMSALLMSLMTVAPSPSWLYALTALAGLGSAAIHPSGSALARRGRLTPELAVALFSAGGMLGYAAGPMLLGTARSWGGAWMLAILVAPGVLAALATLVLLPGDGKSHHARAAASGFPWKLIAGPLGLLTLAAAFAFLPGSAMLNGLPLLLADRHGLDPTDPVLGRTISLYSVASAAGGIGVGLLVSRLRRRALLALVLAGSVPASLSVLIFAPTDPAFFIALVLAGMFGYAATPLLVVAAQDLAPEAEAAASGMVFGLAAALTGVFYFGLGLVQARLGADVALVLAFSGPLIALPIVLPVLRRLPDRPATTGDVLDDLGACACASGTGTLPPRES